MLSSKKALIVFSIQLLFLNFTFGEGKEKSFAQFPPPTFKFAREKKMPHLFLAENPKNKDIPFWRSRESVHNKMLEDRHIPVSVTKQNLPDGFLAFDVKGAGIVHTPASAALKTSQEFNKLTQVSSHFKSAYYDEKNSQLFLILEALGYETRMIMAIDLVKEKKRTEIQFEVVWGELKGMKGAIGFEPVGEESCEVSILSHYKAKSFPLPKIFMGFAFEVITQKVAEKMRTFIENEK